MDMITTLREYLSQTDFDRMMAWMSKMPPDQQAEMILASARKAYTERNYPFAADRFREFLQKFGGHAKAADARYGLALVLLEQPERQYAQAIEQLQNLAGNKAMPEHPFVLYYLGLSKRALGLGELAQAAAILFLLPCERLAGHHVDGRRRDRSPHRLCLLSIE